MKELENFTTPQNQKMVLEKFLYRDAPDTFIDLTEIKDGGVPIDEVIDSLKRLSE